MAQHLAQHLQHRCSLSCWVFWVAGSNVSSEGVQRVSNESLVWLSLTCIGLQVMTRPARGLCNGSIAAVPPAGHVLHLAKAVVLYYSHYGVCCSVTPSAYCVVCVVCWQDLLPILEGSVVPTKYGNVSTDHVLFIASGAFHSSKPSDMLAELQVSRAVRTHTQCSRWPSSPMLASAALNLIWNVILFPASATIYSVHDPFSHTPIAPMQQ